MPEVSYLPVSDVFSPHASGGGGGEEGSTLMSEIRPGVCSGSKCVMDLKVTCLVELTQPQKPRLAAALRNGVGRSRNRTTSGGRITVSLKSASA